jgi:NADH-quinone oxidoreductase subunit C
VGLTPGDVLGRVRDALGDSVLESHEQVGDATVVIEREAAPTFFRALRDRPELAFNFLMDVTAVDFLGRSTRFEVVYHLYSLTHNARLRVKIRVGEQDPWVHSLLELWNSANWLERETWDMFGIRFVGHSDLRRILLYEEFVGHPLRKDYPVDKRQPLTPERDPIQVGWKF